MRHIVETSVALGRVVCEKDTQRAKERDAFLLAARQAGNNPLGGQGGQAAQLAHGVLQQNSAGAGELFPQPHVKSAGGAARLDDVVGADVRLIAATGESVSASRPHTRVVSLGADTLIECGGPSADAWLRERGAIAALVRPDHYVYGTAANAADAATLVESFWNDVTNNPSSLGESR